MATQNTTNSDGFQSLVTPPSGGPQNTNNNPTYSPSDGSDGFVPLTNPDQSPPAQGSPSGSPVMPATPGAFNNPVGDALKAIPNALGDVWNLVKSGTVGTIENVAKIPSEAINLVKEQGIGGAAKNLAKSAPGVVGETISSLIPKSLKELGNTEALSDIPSQFQDLVKQNGGSYANALLSVLQNIPGSIPAAAQSYANQIDRARQAVENHPVNEFLGYMGLKTLAANKIEIPQDSVLNKPVGEIPGDVVKSLPGSDVVPKMVRRVGDVIQNKSELNQQPDVVKSAVKTDIPQPQAELIHQANPEEKNVMQQMLDLQKEGTKKLVMNPEDRPDAKIGQQVVNMVKFLNDQKKSAQIIEGEHVKNLANNNIDYSQTANSFSNKLDQLNIRVRNPEEILTEKGKVGPLDFSKSELDGPASAKDRSLLEMTYNKLKPNENGDYIKPANELHIARQSLFNETQNKNFTEPFSNKIVNMVQNDTGDSVRSNLLHDISAQAGETGKGYQLSVTKNAKIQDALQTVGKLMGKNSGATGGDIQNLRAGEVANRIGGNASAVVENALQKLEDTAKENGFKSKVSIRKLVAFKTILKNVVGETQSNSLAGAVEQGAKAALPDALDIAGEAHSGGIVGTIKAAAKFVKGNTKAEQVRAIQNLLDSTYEPPAQNGTVTKTVPELMGIKPENVDKLKTFIGLGKKAAEKAGIGEDYQKIMDHVSSRKNTIDPTLGF